jgi:hypothetical protein
MFCGEIILQFKHSGVRTADMAEIRTDEMHGQTALGQISFDHLSGRFKIVG